jgi:lysyl-tRNA synthetase, class I
MGGMSKPTSNYWLDQIAAKIMAAHPEGEIVVESGHAPSGYYTVGTLREVLTASAIALRLNQLGRTAKHVDFVDDFDAFRKVPAGVPETWKQYIGVPLYMVPDPTGRHESWAAWLTSEFYGALEQMGLDAEIRWAHEEYPAGTFTEYVELALEHMDEGRQIITSLSKRELPENWSPVQILSDKNNLREWEFAGWDKARRVVKWRDRDGATGEVPYDTGRVKLDWRFDWPARWAKLGVDVEPFGRDHASSGGSYDTGAAIVRQIFRAEPPIPVPYDFINQVGETKKISKSAGNAMTAAGVLEIMPGEIVRYFILKSLPSRKLVFDEGLGLYRLIDEYGKVQQEVAAGGHPEFEEAYRIAAAQTAEQTISSVPFGHLVQCYQAAGRDAARTLAILGRTGYGEAVARERTMIERELKFVANWLDKYAPVSVKFSVQEQLPEVELTDVQRAFLGKLAAVLEPERGLDGQGMHDAIYAAAQDADCKPNHAFVALYRVILGQDSGPKAGWFLAELDHDWLVERLKAASA